MKERRKLIAKYGISTALAMMIAWAVLSTHGFMFSLAISEQYRLLCDAFFVPGVLLLSAGALIFASNHGTFDGLSYASRYVARMFVPWSGKRDESFGEYVRRKEEKGKIKGYGFLFLVGGIFMAVSVLFLLLFFIAS